MDSLPIEMLEHIFNFMDNQELCKIQLVCHTWKAVIDGIIIGRYLKTSPHKRPVFSELEFSDRIVVAKHFGRNLLKNCNFGVSYELNEENHVLPGRLYFFQFLLHWETRILNESMFSTRLPRVDSIPKHFIRAHGIGDQELNYMLSTNAGFCYNDEQSQTIHLIKDLNITEEFMDRIQPTVYFEEWIETYSVLCFDVVCSVSVEMFDDNGKLLASKCISLISRRLVSTDFRRVRSSLKGYGKGARMIRFTHKCRLTHIMTPFTSLNLIGPDRACKFALPRVTFALEDFQQTVHTKRCRFLISIDCFKCRSI